MGWFYPQGIRFNPTTDLNISRILDGVSLADDQQPTTTGEAGSIQIEYGPAVNTISDPVMLSANGDITFNVAGTYRIKASVTFGRQGNGGTAKPRFGAFINGVQAGLTIGGDVPSQNSESPFEDEAWLTVPAGLVVSYRLMRDSSGANDGGLFKPTVTTATAPSWNQATSAAIRVEQWV